ncbi:alpha-L-fucosidase [Psychrosphaera sp. 1_MG-2023]|uniref:alpha-L-fucosidase n=1 Tax=Psychrosphaera sp. 1_MG-2023 TaxID=3062643 RepID=UPI0026E43D7A|nr:alpha-L-fucosidase [Psychrosphaera sp. 1_MG-2023]MDO6721477.1 alpha-L-fucosidase [Psychrosphaera sp. 1_MG-2023]
MREPGGKTKFTVNGVRRSDIAEEIRLNPEAALLYGPTSYSKEFVDDYVARWKEIQAKYDPDFLWMDDYPILTRDGNKSNLSRNNTNPPPPEFRPEVQYFYDQVRLMITDFMNEAAAKGKQVYLNNKGGNPNFPAGVGAYEKDNLRLKSIGPKWQSCTTFGTSFGYLAAEEREDYPFKKKSDKEVIHEMIEIISRNGNFLINIGPKADGTIPSWQVQRLKNMGTWLKINGEAIYGSRYWKHTEQKKDKLYFTVKGNDLFAIAAEQPNHPFTIKGTKGWADSTVKRVSLLGSSKQIKWHLNGKGLVIEPPKDFGESEHAWVFKIETVNNQFVRSSLDKGVESIKDNEIHSKDSTDYN